MAKHIKKILSLLIDTNVGKISLIVYALFLLVMVDLLPPFVIGTLGIF